MNEVDLIIQLIDIAASNIKKTYKYNQWYFKNDWINKNKNLVFNKIYVESTSLFKN